VAVVIPGLRNEIAEALASACEKTFGVVPARRLLEMPPGRARRPGDRSRSTRETAEAPKIAEGSARIVNRRGESRGRGLRQPGWPRISAMLNAGVGKGDLPLSAHVKREQGGPHRAPPNAVLGDVLVLVFRRLGRTVEVRTTSTTPASRWPTSSSASSTPAISPSRRRRKRWARKSARSSPPSPTTGPAFPRAASATSRGTSTRS
jgi:hypothetical protein